MHRIPLPLPNDGLRAVNVYAIVDGDGVVLIDAGWALDEARTRLAAGLGEIGFELGDVREFLVTHAHRDHYTQAVVLRRVFGSRVSLGAGERECLRLVRSESGSAHNASRLREAGAADIARQAEAWRERADPEEWTDPDRWLDDGVELPLSTRTLRVIATPGHTRGHVVYLDSANQALFSGDHVLPHITPSIGVEPNRPPSPLRDYLASLALVRALPDARLFPAHGPVAESVHERVDELLAHHADRLEATAGVVDHGAETGFEAARALPWTRRGRRFDDLDLFNQILAVQETMAHLRVLVDQGALTRSDVDGVAHFARI